MAQQGQKFHWRKLTDFDPSFEKIEEWQFRGPQEARAFSVSVTCGKAIELGTVKRRSPSRGELEYVSKMRNYFETVGDFVAVLFCPVCNASIECATPVSKAWRAVYHRCSNCSHVYTNLAPSDAALKRHYEDNTLNSEYYIRPDEVELRLREIYRPKFAWILKQYERVYGRRPRSILDLGAGSGHFLYACKESGLEVGGLEINKTYQDWARKNLDIELTPTIEELRKSGKTFDIVTSFNTIEHIPNPSDFLSTYQDFSSGQSLSVMETPRFDSIGVWVERMFPERIKGILIPYNHVQLFTDSSLATLLAMRGFSPVSAWFFGQDAKDVFFQIGEELGADGDDAAFEHFNELQKGIDLANASNLMMFAAVPPGGSRK